jgi:hypothetical protein
MCPYLLYASVAFFLIKVYKRMIVDIYFISFWVICIYYSALMKNVCVCWNDMAGTADETSK